MCKKLMSLFICLLSTYSVAQTLHTDDKGVSIFYKIEQTKKYTFCLDNATSVKNFSKDKIIIWKITIGLENGYSDSIVPRGVGIANISVSPNPIKPYPQNYCNYSHVENYKPDSDNMDQSLFVWPIRDYVVKEIKPGEVITNTTYLYLYEGQSPKLTNWQFLGYRLKKDFTSYDPILNDVVNGPKSITLLDHKTKYKAKNLEVKVIDKAEVINIPKVKIRDIHLNTTEATSFSSIPVKEIKTLKEDAYMVDKKVITNKQIEPVKNESTKNAIASIKCPDKKSLEYKEKSNNAPDQSTQRAYSWLSLYYTYKCECEMGSPRSDQLVPVINNVVDSYATNTNGAFGKISKVTKCTSPETNQ